LMGTSSRFGRVIRFNNRLLFWLVNTFFKYEMLSQVQDFGY
jgi:hypothetical protein